MDYVIVPLYSSGKGFLFVSLHYVVMALVGLMTQTRKLKRKSTLIISKKLLIGWVGNLSR